MLAVLGVATIALLLTVIMTKRMSPLIALILIPIIACLIGGFGWNTSKFIVSGLQSLAPVVGMFVFAILFFGVVTDAGMLDPIIDRILRTVGTRPTRIVMGTTLLALLIHLDGSGAVTFLITIPAMLPLYDRLGIDRRILACAASLAAGVNFLPWTGPMIRALRVTQAPHSGDLQSAGAGADRRHHLHLRGVLLAGTAGEKRLGLTGGASVDMVAQRKLSDAEQALRRPQNFWINIVLTVLVLGTMVALGDKLAPAIVFMVGLCLALLINYRSVDEQRQRIDAHAKAALLMASVLLAAGVFTGIMQGSGMLKAMAETAVGFVPAAAAKFMPLALGVVSMPLSLLFDPDSFYFGVLPVIAEVGGQLGVSKVQLAQGALLSR